MIIIRIQQIQPIDTPQITKTYYPPKTNYQTKPNPKNHLIIPHPPTYYINYYNHPQK